MPDHLTQSPAQTQRPAPCKPCGHARHVGTCSTCQRAQLERWNTQLAQALPARRPGQH